MTLRLLILSFSPIERDARVLKQVREFAADFEVTTCGFGARPDERVQHLQIPDGLSTRPGGYLLQFRQYRASYWANAAVRAARKLLAGNRFDIVLANDIDAVPLALALRPVRGVHADLHEYHPLIQEQYPEWLARVAPFYYRLCERYLPRASSLSTVSQGLARKYTSEFGVEPVVIRNSAPFADVTPTPTADPIRLVHSGAALRGRSIHTLIEAVAGHGDRFTLDLYLTRNDPGYIDEMREMSQDLPHVRVHDPVPHADLAATLQAHDVGIHVLPPLNFNNANALPNKLFDYLQARLAVVVGPTPEMADIVTAHGFGAVTADFSAPALEDTLAGLTVAGVDQMKSAAHTAASELTSAKDVALWREAIDRLAAP